MSDLDVYRASRRANVHGALKTVYRSTGPLRWILLAVLFMPCGCHRRQAAETVLSKDETYLAGFGSGGIPLDYEASVVGSDKCANCHAEQCEQQATHHMAHTGAMIGPANQEKIFSEERLALPFKQYPGDAPFSGRYQKTEDGVFLTVDQGNAAPLRARADVVFGARNLTMLTAEEGRRLRELCLSYSRLKNCWFVTPSHTMHEGTLGELGSVAHSTYCLSCHASVVAWRDDRLDPQASTFGVSCERCHGPGSAHIAAVEKNESDLKIYNSGRLSAYEQVLFCTQCHRKPADLSPRDVLNMDSEVARHAGAGLMLSACFRQSPAETTISCQDCHNPHTNAEDSVHHYNQSCLRCHEDIAKSHTSAVVTTDSDCVGCHMQKIKSPMGWMEFTNHWIRNPDQPVPRGTSEEPVIYALLEKAYRAHLLDPNVDTDRKSMTATSLAEILFVTDRMSDGMRQIEDAIELNPDNPLPYERLAGIYRMLGRNKDAIEAYDQAIRIKPTNATLRFSRGRLLADEGKGAEALADLKIALPLSRPETTLHRAIVELIETLSRRQKTSP